MPVSYMSSARFRRSTSLGDMSFALPLPPPLTLPAWATLRASSSEEYERRQDFARRPGDCRPGDSRPGDSRPGDSRPGDSRPGDSLAPARAPLPRDGGDCPGERLSALVFVRAIAATRGFARGFANAGSASEPTAAAGSGDGWWRMGERRVRLKLDVRLGRPRFTRK